MEVRRVRVSSSNVTDVGFWKSTWRLEVPTKRDITLRCKSNGDHNLLDPVAIVCWDVWKARNEVVFRKGIMDADRIANNAYQLWNDFVMAQMSARGAYRDGGKISNIYSLDNNCWRRPPLERDLSINLHQWLSFVKMNKVKFGKQQSRRLNVNMLLPKRQKP
ncbi:conserved hypothetical protein [Ricinus communis]|uniref:Uncharacterized protein n=1 Tax=Ricinus communis TaxID=3988 RepID=B9RHI4_RICCO|nr:conserved hypothetical protein [Ricinus communis]